MRRPLALATLAALALAAAALSGCAAWRVDKAAQVASSTTSHWLCAGVFISGRDAAISRDELLRPLPGMGLVNWALHYEVDREHREVRSSIAGGFRSRAVYRDRLGCSLVEPDAKGSPASVPDTEDWPVPSQPDILPAPVSPAPAPNPQLAAAIERAFVPPSGDPDQHTLAVAVLRDGRLIAERYAPGITAQTPLHGFSATKSLSSALVGALVQQGRLDVHQPAPIPAWQDPQDPRHAITLDHLLRQASGLDLDYDTSGFDRSTQILYSAQDKAAAIASTPLAVPPGTQWHYTDPNYLLVGRVIRDAVTGPGPHRPDADALAVRRFLRESFFGPLGMRSAVMEIDPSGSPIGAVHAYATARDWARFGQLFLDDGMAGPRRILPAGWVRYSTTPTLDTGYGAGWYLNTVDRNVPGWGHGEVHVAWGLPSAPRDTFFARGFFGQFVIVIPSQRLVIVRFDASQERSAKHIAWDTDRLVAGIVDALR
ncbi:serine hydrolase domain-containing protein [Aquabacterium sp.]|uniref:serine hydrolase domain-containing protein n=1 Tax=Aquabacterium sp. TaxID=1872578 RepID=UPI00378463AB